jgi:hypothetical protein
MKRKSASLSFLFLSVVGGGVVGLQGRAGATTFTVNESVDAINGNGKCSFREALVAANSNRTANDCGLGQSGGVAVDRIVLPAGATFAITDNLHIKDAVVITSTGRATITPSASNPQIDGFTVMPGVNQVELYNLDLLSFKNPAIILADSSQARVFDVTVQNGVSVGANSQNGSIEVDANANLQLTRVLVNHQWDSIKGGALIVYPGAWVTLGDSIFSNNRAQQYGGAIDIQSGGTVYCKRSSITNNHADIAGGGVAISVGGTFTQNDCDVSGNTAPTSPNIHQF